MSMKKKAMVPGSAELSKHSISVCNQTTFAPFFIFSSLTPATKIGMIGGKISIEIHRLIDLKLLMKMDTGDFGDIYIEFKYCV